MCSGLMGSDLRFGKFQSLGRLNRVAVASRVRSCAGSLRQGHSLSDDPCGILMAQDTEEHDGLVGRAFSVGGCRQHCHSAFIGKSGGFLRCSPPAQEGMNYRGIVNTPELRSSGFGPLFVEIPCTKILLPAYAARYGVASTLQP